MMDPMTFKIGGDSPMVQDTVGRGPLANFGAPGFSLNGDAGESEDEDNDVKDDKDDKDDEEDEDDYDYDDDYSSSDDSDYFMGYTGRISPPDSPGLPPEPAHYPGEPSSEPSGDDSSIFLRELGYYSGELAGEPSASPSREPGGNLTLGRIGSILYVRPLDVPRPNMDADGYDLDWLKRKMIINWRNGDLERFRFGRVKDEEGYKETYALQKMLQRREEIWRSHEIFDEDVLKVEKR